MLWASYILPATRLSEFMLGIVAYQIYQRSVDGKLRLSKHATLIEIAAIAIALFGMWAGDLNYFSDTDATIWRLWFSTCSGSVGFALLIVIFSLEMGAVSRFLRHRPLVYLGEISFCLYMVHQLVLRFMQDHPSTLAWASASVIALSYWLATIICAAALYHVIERPVRSYIVEICRRGFGRFRAAQ
jgi:peptidoglycan/LPS O-acetylase OafA/YrhL